MFGFIRKNREINPYSVNDTIRFRNGEKTITLTVKDDAGRLVAGLKKAHEKLSEVTEESSECEQINAARFMAKSIFGEEQADRLVDFYNGEALTILTVCGTYFQEILSKKINRAQKK